MHRLLEAGTLTPVVDRTFPLSEVPEAIRYLREGHARGKVVITVKGTTSPEDAGPAVQIGQRLPS